jgi:hypothetical protein
MTYHGRSQERVIYEVTGRAVRDGAFRDRLQQAIRKDIKRGDGQITELNRALKAKGYALTSDQVKALQSQMSTIDQRLDALNVPSVAGW